MALPTTTPSSWMQSLDVPSRPFGGVGGDDYEPYGEDDEFVLTITMPGFERDDTDVAWDDGVLNVAAEHVNEERSRKKTVHRRFRFPKEIDDEGIMATYTNGVLDVRLPATAGAPTRGKSIPVEG